MHNLTLGYLNVGESNLCLRKKVLKIFLLSNIRDIPLLRHMPGHNFLSNLNFSATKLWNRRHLRKSDNLEQKTKQWKKNNNNDNNQRTSDLSRPPNSYFDLQMKSKGNFERQQACGPCLQSPPSLKQNRFCLRAEGGAPVHRRGHGDFWCCGVAYFFCAQDCSE